MMIKYINKHFLLLFGSFVKKVRVLMYEICILCIFCYFFVAICDFFLVFYIFLETKFIDLWIAFHASHYEIAEKMNVAFCRPTHSLGCLRLFFIISNPTTETVQNHIKSPPKIDQFSSSWFFKQSQEARPRRPHKNFWKSTHPTILEQCCLFHQFFLISLLFCSHFSRFSLLTNLSFDINFKKSKWKSAPI